MPKSALSAQSGFERMGGVAVVAIVLIPLVLGVLLTSGLASPTARADRITAAIVNDDVPVTVNGNSVPLGRQFSAALIAGGGDQLSASSAGGVVAPPDDNFTWILTNGDDAAAGLSNGFYTAVVTIPPSFSADAMSISGPAASAKQAVFHVSTSPGSAYIDPALTEAITSAATTALNQKLTTQYLQNVYAGFNTIDDQMAQAASGAVSLASGASSVSSGAQSLATGTSSLAAGLVSLSRGAASLSAGAASLDQQVQPLPSQTGQLAEGSAALAHAADNAQTSVAGATSSFSTVVAELCQKPGPLCTSATNALGRLQNADAGMTQLASGADAVASGNAQLAAAMPSLVSGVDQVSSGAGQVAYAAVQASSGGASVNEGAASLVGGAEQVDSGAAQLSQSLGQAVTQIPTYSTSDMSTLAAVAAEPVVAQQALGGQQGSLSVPLFCVIALWFGGLVLALVRKAVPSSRLLTTTASWMITGRSVAIGSLLGAAQGLLVAPVLLFGMAVDRSEWVAFTGLSVLAGIVFALVNQGLVAAFGAVGRVIALFAGVITLIVGLVSTVPPAFLTVAGLLPTTPAVQMLRASAIGDTGGAWTSAAVCTGFGVVGIALVFAGVIGRRSVRTRALSPARTARW